MRLDHITSSGLGLDDIVRENPMPATSQDPMRDWRLNPFPGWRRSNRLPGEISAVEPPDPIPNSEVKRSCADGSVAQAMQE